MSKQADYTYIETEMRGEFEVSLNGKVVGSMIKDGKWWVVPNGTRFERRYLASAFLSADYALNIIFQETTQIGEASVIHYRLGMPAEFRDKYSGHALVVGIDPGSAKCGVSILDPYIMEADCFEIRFPNKDTDLVHRMMRVKKVFSELRGAYLPPFHLFYLVVEGADYGSVFGQADLAMARTVQTLELYPGKEELVNIVAPKKIRSLTFKDGDMRAEEVWRFLPPNLASSLCCSLSGLSLFQTFLRSA